MKKLIAIFLFIGIMMTNVCAYNSEVKYSKMSDAELSSITYLSELELAQARDLYGDNFENVIKEYVASGAITPYFSPMGSYDWSKLVETFDIGVIIVSKDQSTVVRHGHAAIYYAAGDVIEHPGKKDDGTPLLSQRRSAEVAFRQLGAVATFKPKNVTSQQMTSAGLYAKNNLIGWRYNVLSDRNSTSTLNCATLVWKAYQSANINICSPGSGTVTPSNIATNGYTTQLYATGQYVGAAWPFSL